MSYFDFVLSSQQVNEKFHFYKYTYTVSFPHLRDLNALEEIERVLNESFTTLIDDARGRLGEGVKHMQVSLVNEHLPGGQVDTLLVLTSSSSSITGGYALRLAGARRIRRRTNRS